MSATSSDPAKHADAIADLGDITGTEMWLLTLEEVFPKSMQFGFSLEASVMIDARGRSWARKGAGKTH